MSLPRHLFGILAGSAAVGVGMMLTTTIGALIRMPEKLFGGPSVLFSLIAFWLALLIIALVAVLAAIPVAAVAFSAARVLLGRVGNNFGAAYTALGTLLGLLLLRNMECEPHFYVNRAIEIALLGAAGGLVYWNVAARSSPGPAEPAPEQDLV